MWKDYYCAASVEDVLDIIAREQNRARIVAGATDLILEIQKGLHKEIETLVDITRIPDLDKIIINDDVIHIGPLVTHNHCLVSEIIRKYAFPLGKAAWSIGSPQIRNRGTIAGNLVTASPANDTIPPLIALGASVVLQSVNNKRTVLLQDFYEGVRKTIIHPDEMLVDICFPALIENQRGTFLKVALRRAQAISLVNVAVILQMRDQYVDSAKIALGAVAPVIIRAVDAERYLIGKRMDDKIIEEAAELAADSTRPISDIRSSLGYRKSIVKVITRRALNSLLKGEERDDFPDDPPVLRTTNSQTKWKGPTSHKQGTPIITMINGKEFHLVPSSNKTLLRLIREDAGLTGTKEGCAEGECGACTVFMDGMAVMSCMVPAARAHMAEITTIEGLGTGGELHPMQRSFIDNSAVQCGYCTPGFIMSAAKLMQENPHPTRQQIKQAITGNLCRCTGYYKIIRAIESAVEGEVK